MAPKVLNWLLENCEPNTWISLKKFPGQLLGIRTQQIRIPRKIFERSIINEPSSKPPMASILCWLLKLMQRSGIMPHLPPC